VVSDAGAQTDEPAGEAAASAGERLPEIFGPEDKDLLSIYSKAKRQQWDANRDLDWSHELDPDNPLRMPDGAVVIYGTPVWDRLDEAGRRQVRLHSQAWTISQILHGEQAALLCAAKIVQEDEDTAVKLCASSQVIDEARHVEVYSRLLSEKFTLSYPVSPSLKRLLDDAVGSRTLDITNLGMQILVEGMALSLFQNVAAYGQDPLVRDLMMRVMRDESRHFAIGRITLRRLYQDMSPGELRLREEFVCDATTLIYDHLCADDVWEPLGLSRKECGALVRESPIANNLRRSLFRRVVPSIREMGLLTDRVARTFTQLNVIEYASAPVRET
jgi:hypothetical protein